MQIFYKKVFFSIFLTNNLVILHVDSLNYKLPHTNSFNPLKTKCYINIIKRPGLQMERLRKSG